MRIDAHHHFWTYNPTEYAWIDESMAAIRRDYRPRDLQPLLAPARIDGVVSVQARQTLAETEWLLRFAAEYPFIRGVVGWVDLRSPTVADELDRVMAGGRLKGVRHVLQGEPDPEFVLGREFNRGIEELGRRRLAYDILVFEHQLPQVIRFVDRHPEQVFILDHAAKPRIQAGHLQPWADRLRELARRPNVYCKLSGMVTEADYATWTEAQLQPFVHAVFDAFGPRRVMFGSDWPVCLVASPYVRWVAVVQRFVQALSSDEQARIFGGTAIEAYHL